ncbi:mechanosensitive ion channel family protein [Aliivibrio fischeri]|uniref:mechanosensitive ion channel family protein n=1 Tax=Aliivibrio fischeri TaxID=668 RepID=UPI0012D91433|nr:mechanosensitive ion channel family protein [Aliivibrio fischeri]MUK70691.1 mechanosensitive ion channel [Aliivibrio fischeri]MUK75031.1 mechanosensitive ion channel [Aliivibrio fischeri]MUK79050.1 mechanosensitive ion channel [Aliivibrio fischeri]
MTRFLDWWNTLLEFKDHDWAQNIIVITLFSAFLWLSWRVIIRRLHHIAAKTQLPWDDAVITAISAPVTLVIWLWPATASLKILLSTQTHFSSTWLPELQVFILIWGFIWSALRLTSLIEKQFLTNPKHDETTVLALGKVVRLIFITLGVLSLMQGVGLSLSGLLTFGGVGGLVVGLAAKDLLSNFFGGMMIYFDRPFKVGDWIRSPDRSLEGTVERIGWRMTVIRTFDKRPLYVPNSVFSNIVVENPSRMLNRRIKEDIGIRYDDIHSIERIVDEIKTMLQEHNDIDSNQTLIVNFNGFGPSSLDLLVYTFTKTVNWIEYHKVKQDVLIKIGDIIAQNNAEIAFPTQTLKVEQIPSE